MKILICVRRLDFGGAELLEARLGVNLVKMGHEVCLIGQYGGYEFDATEHCKRWSALGIKSVFWLRAGGGLGPLRAAWNLRQVALGTGADVVLTSNDGLDGIAYLSKLMGASFSHVIAHHTYPLMREMSLLKQVLWVRAVRAAAINYAISRYVRTHVSHACGMSATQISVVLNSLAPEVFATVSDRAWVQKEFGFSSEERILVFVGRLVRYKRCHFLIERIGPRLREWNARLLIVGGHYEGPAHKAYFSSLLEQAKRVDAYRIVFAGHRADAARIVAGSDLLVHPTEREGFGLVIAEALTLGTPVVATNIGGIPEVLSDTPYSPIPIGDNDLFVARVEQWLFTDLAQASQIRAVAQKAIERFSDQRRSVEIATLFEKAISSRSET